MTKMTKMTKANPKYLRWQKEYFKNATKKFNVLPAGRRTGKTMGAALFALKSLAAHESVLWGDTVNSNIDRYVERYFKPVLRHFGMKYKWSSQRKELRFENGHIDFRSADRPENWEGFGYKKIILNEAGIILKNANLFTESVLPMMADFTGSQLFAIGTPKGRFLKTREVHPYYALFQKCETDPENHFQKTLTMYDNPLLDEVTRDIIIKKMQGANPALVRQEIFGEFVDGAEMLYWDDIILSNCTINRVPENLAYECLSIDPAITTKAGSDETGIFHLGKDYKGVIYLIDDLSGKHTPGKIQSIVKLYEDRINSIFYESNQGGDYIKKIVKDACPKLYVKDIYSSKSKVARAEIAFAVYEENKVKHCKEFDKLNGELKFISSYKDSPNRADAAVQGINQLNKMSFGNRQSLNI